MVKEKLQSKRFWMVLAVTLLLMFGFGYLPTFGQVTPQGMQILGIFLGCIFAWCFGEIAWSAVLGLVCLELFDFGTMSTNFANAFANGTVSMMIVAFVFCYGVEQSGLLREVSRWIVGSKWAQRSPWMLAFAFFLASAVGGAIATNVLPPLVLLWTLFYDLADEVGIKRHSAFSSIVLLGIGVSGYVGVAVMPYSAMTVLVIGAAQSYDPSF